MDRLSMQHIQEHDSPVSSGLTEGMFIRLYQDNLTSVLNFVGYRLGLQEAEDITADIFARLWAHREDFHPTRGTPVTWLWAIARNAVTDRLRQRKPTDTNLSEDLASMFSAEKDPLLAVSQREEWDQIQDILTRLTAVDQEIIALRFGAGFTNRAIAPILEMSEANVAQRLRRALRSMRHELQAKGSVK